MNTAKFIESICVVESNFSVWHVFFCVWFYACVVYAVFVFVMFSYFIVCLGVWYVWNLIEWQVQENRRVDIDSHVAQICWSSTSYCFKSVRLFYNIQIAFLLHWPLANVIFLGGAVRLGKLHGFRKFCTTEYFIEY